MKRIVINGRGLGGAINGIPRYMAETVRSLDRAIGDGYRAELVVPTGTKPGFELKKIRVVELPHRPAWDYTAAEHYARRQKALYINLGSKGVWYRNSIATIHDIRPLTIGDGKLTFNSLKTRLKFGISYHLAVRRSRVLNTISQFSKNEIIKYSGVRPGKITVIGCGWEHICETQSDCSVFDEFTDIKKGSYYFAVSSIAPHKNFGWIVENARLHPECQYVIVGKTDLRVWLDETDRFRGNVLYLGYQSDERVKALIENAKALVFPSRYEGFGIPPIEAIALGTPTIVSDIEVLREIYGDCTSYLDPDDPSVSLDELLKSKCAPSESLLKKHSWEAGSRKWLRLIDKLCR